MKKYAKENYNNNLETIISSKDNGNKTFWQVMGRFMGKPIIWPLFHLYDYQIIIMLLQIRRKLNV